MRWCAAALCALFVSGCGGSPHGQQRTVGTNATAEEAKPAFKRSCSEYAGAPVAITYEDAPGGAAVLYRTQGNVEKLRERTEHVARFHNDSTSKTPWLHDLYSIPHRAYVSPLPDGAKLVLIAKGIAKRRQDELRSHVQQDVWIMQRKGCGAGQEAL